MDKDSKEDARESTKKGRKKVRNVFTSEKIRKEKTGGTKEKRRLIIRRVKERGNGVNKGVRGDERRKRGGRWWGVLASDWCPFGGRRTPPLIWVWGAVSLRATAVQEESSTVRYARGIPGREGRKERENGTRNKRETGRYVYVQGIFERESK